MPTAPRDRANFQALQLIYLGVEQEPYGTDTGGDFAEPDQLAYANDEPIEALGPEQARNWLERCRAVGACEFEDFCTNRGGWSESEEWNSEDLWIDCP